MGFVQQSRGVGASFGVVLAALVSFAAAPASAYSPIPEFPGVGGVAVSEAAVDPAPIRAALAQYVSPVGAQYSVLIAEFSDRENRPGPDYGDADARYIESVVERWGNSANRETGVFIVVSMSNRDVIVHPFSRFAALGFEQDVVTQTIDRSTFGIYARSGDYAQAILGLAMAVDEELARRLEAAASERQQLEHTATAARGAVARFESNAATSRFDVSDGRTFAREVLDRVRGAERALARPEASALTGLEQTLSQDIARLDGWFVELETQDGLARETLARIRVERARLEWDPRIEDSTTTKARARTLAATIDDAERRLAAGDPHGANALLDRALSEAFELQQALDTAAIRYFFFFRVLPIVCFLGFSVLLARVLRERRRKAANLVFEANTRLEALDVALGHASTKLVELENEHAVFLSSDTSPNAFTGASAAPIREAAACADDLFLAFEAATRLAAEARSKLAGVGAFDVGGAGDALALLTTEPFVVRTEQVTERKLLLPDEREISLVPSALLAELETRYADVQTKLDAIGTRIGSVHDRLDTFASTLADIAADYGEVRAREPGFPSGATFEALEAERFAFVTEAKLDPIGVEAKLDAFATRVEAETARADSAVEVEDLVHDRFASRIGALAARIGTIRATGAKLSEPGFDPDARIAAIETEVRAIRRRLAAGAVEEAAERSRRVSADLESLERSVDESESTRVEGPSRVAAVRTKLDSAEASVPGRLQRIDALLAKYTARSLGNAYATTTDMNARFTGVRAAIATAHASLTTEKQAYLTAKRALDDADDTLEDLDAWSSAVDGKEAELEKILVDADEDRSMVRETLATTRRLVMESAPHGSQGAPAELDAIEERLALCDRLRAEVPVDATTLAKDAEQLAERSRVVFELASTDSEALEDCRTRLAGARYKLDALGVDLERSTDDRDETNRAHESVRAEIALLAASFDTPIERPVELRVRIDAAVGRLDAARAGASRDFAAADEARRAIATAHDAIRNAETMLQAGEIGGLDGLKRHLASARSALERKEYTQAKQGAESVDTRCASTIASIRAERERQRAERERALIEAERRRRERVERRQWLGSSSSGSSWSGSSHRSSHSSSSSHRSSHSSSGSSRSSSGSSSFGSSSGRSSFGSSSGRSKW